ncbi:hypothetical protein GCM10023185_30660 [Hymenobacter saemangeumensis]|uniref:2TM domain-containing protein n=1 Tax=Hymenobacter saemangeumensis TaxID=1084522 RepID=A0ABP8IMB2_9BACT
METNTAPTRDPELWRQAKSRAAFKSHLFTYLSVNGLLWLIWAVTTRGRDQGLPWPVWSTFFWGIGVLSQAVRVYGGWDRKGMAEREYERLTRQS